MAIRLVLLAALLWAAAFSFLAIERHDAFESNAFDLGYVTQTLWNTIHGRPYVFTTVDGIPTSPEVSLNVDRLRHPHSLLAFHVEPDLLLVALPFALWSDPRLLLVLQAALLAGGAVAIAALARRRTGREGAGVAFGLGFLLSPSLAAAALSDFHAVTATATLIPATLLLYDIGRRRWALATGLLAAAAREDAAILVAALGAYLYLRESRTREQSNAPSATPAGSSSPWESSRADGLSVRATGQPDSVTPSRSEESRSRPESTQIALTGAGATYRGASHERADRDPSGGGPRNDKHQTATRKLSADELWQRARVRANLNLAGPRLGLWLCLGAGLLAVVSFALIIPFFNGTLSALIRHQPAVASVFWDRYAWLGASPVQAALNLARRPGLTVAWFGQRDVQAYLATLVLSGGAICLLAPDVLAIALPIALLNALSSFDWMRSGGAHYSVVLVPIVVYAGIEGYRRMCRSSMPVPWLGLGVLLVATVSNHVWLDASPFVPGYDWPVPGARQAAVEALLEKIPANASVAATSAIYPHLATRSRAYWFPAVNGADDVAVDVARSTNPIGPSETHARVAALVSSGQYVIAAFAPGFLLLQRSEQPSPTTVFAPPDSFFDFARDRSVPANATRLGTAFGDSLSLDGYTVETRSTQTVFGPDALVTTYWHVTGPVRDQLSFVFFVTRRSDGALSGTLSDAAPEPVWYPPDVWRIGETVHLKVHVPRIDDLQAIGVAVVGGSGERLAVHAPSGAALWENGTIVRITRFDEGNSGGAF